MCFPRSRLSICKIFYIGPWNGENLKKLKIHSERLVVTLPHVVQSTLIRDSRTTNIYTTKFSVVLGDSPAPRANEGDGAISGPITFEHLVSNQGIARSVVANKPTILCLQDAPYKSRLQPKLFSRPLDSPNTKPAQRYLVTFVLFEDASPVTLQLRAAPYRQLSTLVQLHHQWTSQLLSTLVQCTPVDITVPVHPGSTHASGHHSSCPPWFNARQWTLLHRSTLVLNTRQWTSTQFYNQLWDAVPTFMRLTAYKCSGSF